MSDNKQTYTSNGQMLSSPPLSVRVSRTFENIYCFLGLYFVSLFSLDPYAAAQNSPFNIHQPGNLSGSRLRQGGSGFGFWGGGGGGSGGGGGGPGPGSGPRRLGRVDDIREPECGSCR